MSLKYILPLTNYNDTTNRVREYVVNISLSMIA